MKNIKLFCLLKTLTPAEFRQLRKAVQSPFFNTDPAAERLYKALAKQYPDFDGSPQGRQKLFKKVYPKESFRDIRLRRLFSAMTKIVEQFLILAETERDEQSRTRLLTNAYEYRAEETFFKKGIDRQLELVETLPAKNMNYWLEKVRIYDRLYASPYLDHNSKHDQTSELLSEAADCFFSFAKLRYGLVLKSKAKIYQTDATLRFLPAISDAYRAGFMADNELFKFYYTALLLLEQPGDAVFAEYERYFFSNAAKLKGADRRFLFYIGLNHTIRLVNIGLTPDSYEAMYKWYMEGLAQEIIILNGRLRVQDFTNIVSVSCVCAEVEETRGFIRNYKKYLPAAQRREGEIYALAKVHYSIEEYKDTVLLLNTCSFGRYYLFAAKSLLLRALFELYRTDDDFGPLLTDNISAYENLLRRDKHFTDKRKLLQFNFCRHLRKLFGLIQKRESDNLIEAVMTTELTKRPNTAAKEWLYKTIQSGKKQKNPVPLNGKTGSSCQ